AIGIAAPRTARSRRSSSPSPSAKCSLTMAPCRSRNSASTACWAARSATSSAAIRSKASAVTGPLGCALAQASGTSAWPRRAASAMKPEIGRFMPSMTSNSASPRVSPGQPSAATNSSQLAAPGTKLFDSWWNPPIAIFAMAAAAALKTGQPVQRRLQAAALVDKGLAPLAIVLDHRRIGLGEEVGLRQLGVDLGELALDAADILLQPRALLGEIDEPREIQEEGGRAGH